MMNKFDTHAKRLIYAAALTAFGCCLGACTTPPAPLDVMAKTTNQPAQKVNQSPTSISVNQIGARSQGLTAPQIQSNTPRAPQLTVEQLRIFADRCLPNSQLPPPSDLDCSEINLRMQSLLREDDEIIDALITLGQLGRADSLGRAIDDLNEGRSGDSLTGGAIAGGFINGPVPTPAPLPDTPPELEKFLQENGLNINQGIISRLPQP